jgi:type II secretory pathway pseudopilin PulG
MQISSKYIQMLRILFGWALSDIPIPPFPKKGRGRLRYLNAGFTLVEIIIVLVLSFLIIGISYSIFIMAQRAYQQGNTGLEIIQNGRVILDRTSREIRQTNEIITSLPDVPDNPDFFPPEEIFFQDGHTTLVLESEHPQAAGNDSITLSSTSSDENDYYKDMFIKIVEGAGEGQIRKIIDYDGATKTAIIDNHWATQPTSTSTYKIDTSYYYIRYYGVNSEIWREIVVYYFPDDPMTPEDETDIFVPWNSKDADGNLPGGPDSCVFANCPNCPSTCIILENRVIGEYVSRLKFWNSGVINVSMDLKKDNLNLKMETKIKGRNL